MKLIATFLIFFNIFKLQAEDSMLASPNAVVGGDFVINLGAIPETLNPLDSGDGYSASVHGLTFDTLLDRNVDTYEFEPALAESWKIAKDEMSFEFKIREGITWHDGKPLTVEDVKFSFDMIADEKYRLAPKRPYYESIQSAEIKDKKTIVFKCKNKYFKNFDVVAGLKVIPRHVYQNPTKEQDKKFATSIVGSGPYILESFDRSKKLVLKRNPNWWGRNVKENKGRYNFEKIHMKFIQDETISITMAEKGDFDFISFGAEAFMKKTNGPKWGKSVHKIKYENQGPGGYSFIGWNFLEPMFKSKNTRLALYHLVNRNLMIEKFLFNFSVPATGPLYLKSPYANKDVKPVNFDPKKAVELLKKDGWSDTDGDQILDKMIDGKKVKLSFSILEPNQEFIKYLTIFKEDASKVGVDINIKYVEWQTFLKLLDEKKFQAVRLAWGGGDIDWEPKQIWHSSSSSMGGSNFISYNNPVVDKLIDESREIMDKKVRIKKLSEVYKLIADDVPYVFFFNSKYSFYGVADRVKRKKDTYNYSVGTDYWWIQK